MQAEALLAAGEYDAATNAFAKAGSYRDAEERMGELYYMKAESFLALGKYDEAYEAFDNAGDYKDAHQRKNELGTDNIILCEVSGFQPIRFSITVDRNGRIKDIQVVEHKETPGLGADLLDDPNTFTKLIGQPIETAEIDIKAGVTMTSNAINKALQQAADEYSRK